MSTAKDWAKVKAGLQAFEAKVRHAAERAISLMGEDSLARAQDLVPVYKGHLRLSGTVSTIVRQKGDVFVRVGFSSKAGGGGAGLIPPSRKSERETEHTGPVPGPGGSRLVNVAILMHELQAYSRGPSGVPHGPFRYGRSGADANPGGASGTFDAPQAGREPSDGDRGGQYLRRVQRNVGANRRRWGQVLKKTMSVAALGGR